MTTLLVIGFILLLVMMLFFMLRRRHKKNSTLNCLDANGDSWFDDLLDIFSGVDVDSDGPDLE